jgi:hypothetical protein
MPSEVEFGSNFVIFLESELTNLGEIFVITTCCFG